MKYIYSIVLFTFFIGCGNEDYYERRDQVRLLNSAEVNKSVDATKSKTSTVSTIDDTQVVVPVEIEKNSSNTQAVTIAKIEENQTQEQDSSTQAKEEPEPSLEKNVTLVSESKQEISKKGSALESELKRIELEQKNMLIANEKEIALAKLEKEKLLAQEQANNNQKMAEIEALNRKEVELAKLESQKAIALNEKEMAKEKFLYEKEIALAKLQTQKLISENDQKLSESKVANEKEVALAKLEIEKEQKDKDLEFYKMITAIVAGLVILTLLIIYMIHRRNKKIELQLHEDELTHQKYMEASKQHNENLKKMLDIVTDEKTDKNVKKEIVRLLKDQGRQSDLIEHKK